jgi:hypothetical protein
MVQRTSRPLPCFLHRTFVCLRAGQMFDRPGVLLAAAAACLEWMQRPLMGGFTNLADTELLHKA